MRVSHAIDLLITYLLHEFELIAISLEIRGRIWVTSMCDKYENSYNEKYSI